MLAIRFYVIFREIGRKSTVCVFGCVVKKNTDISWIIQTFQFLAQTIVYDLETYFYNNEMMYINSWMQIIQYSNDSNVIMGGFIFAELDGTLFSSPWQTERP